MTYRTFRQVRVYTKDYFHIYFKIAPFIECVSNYYKIPLEKLRFYHYKHYCIENLHYTFGNINEKGNIAGLTKIKNGKVRIGITTHHSISLERQNFSTSHEIAHSIIHRDNNIKTQQFASIEKGINQYLDKKDIIREIEADICASFLMINDNALIEQLRNGKTFLEIKNEFKTSIQATQTRLANFLFYNSNLSYQETFKTIELYKNNIIDLKHFFPEYL